MPKYMGRVPLRDYVEVFPLNDEVGRNCSWSHVTQALGFGFYYSSCWVRVFLSGM